MHKVKQCHRSPQAHLLLFLSCFRWGRGALSRLPPKSVPFLVRAAFGGRRHRSSSHRRSTFHFPFVLSWFSAHLVHIPSSDYMYITLCSRHVCVWNCLFVTCGWHQAGLRRVCFVYCTVCVLWELSLFSLGTNKVRLLSPISALLHLTYLQPVAHIVTHLQNSLQHSILSKLDAVYHSAIRFVTKAPYTHHCDLYALVGWPSLHIRRQIHWLQVIYKALLGKAPPYLRSLFPITTPTRSIRSSRYISLAIPKTNTPFGRLFFQFSAANDWNDLRKSLKLEIPSLTLSISC